MANRKISELTALTNPASGDYLPIVDISEAATANQNKRITIGELFRGVPNGTAAAPSIAFEDDPGNDTGIYSPGADQLAISTGGSGRLFVDSSGRVGINKAALSQTLHVVSETGGTTARFENTSSGNFVDFFETTGLTRMGYIGHTSATDMFIHNDKAGPIVFDTNNTERLRITSAGLVGVGDSAPSNTFTLKAAAGLVNNSDLPSASALIKDSGSNRRLGLGTSSTGNWIQSSYPGDAGVAYSLLLNPLGGSVGIGVTAPTCELEIGGNGHIHLADQGRVGCRSATSSGAPEDAYVKFSDSDIISFHTTDTERARIDSSGRLLIGTSSAISGGVIDSGTGTQSVLPLLQIAGTDWARSSAIFASYQNAAAVFPQISFNKSKSGTVGTIGSALASGDALGGITFSGSDGAKFVPGKSISAFTDAACGTNDMPGRLLFSTTADGASSPTERMRITNAGNIFIGTTSSGGGGWTTTNAGQQITQYSPTSDTRSMYTWQSDNAGTNTTAVYIESNGKIYARTTTVQAISSERRLKENIVPLDADDAWETVKSVPFYSYNFIGADPSNVLYGPIADEVPDEMRVATGQSDDVGVIHTYDNGMLQARLYVALQAALNKIETLEAKVAALEAA